MDGRCGSAGMRAAATPSACMCGGRARRAVGELVMMDSSPFRWLEERGPACHLIAMIDEPAATCGAASHCTTRVKKICAPWAAGCERYGRPLALYTDKNSLFVTSRPVQWQEQLHGHSAAHAVRPRSGGTRHRVDRGALSASERAHRAALQHAARPAGQRNASLAEIATLEQANRFLEITFWPAWSQRFAVEPAQSSDAHRRLQRAQQLEQILSVRVRASSLPTTP